MKSNMIEQLSASLSKITKGKVNEANVKYVLGGFIGLVVLLVVIILVAVSGASQEKTGRGTTETKAVMETGSTETSVTEESVVAEVELEENAYAEINDLVSRYFVAMAAGDMETVTALESPMTDMKKLTIEEKSKYIESFDNITVYTKPGPDEESKIVFVYNEVRFYNIETTAAAVNTMYACKNEEGNYYFFGGEIDEEKESYINAVIEQADVVELFNRADVKFQEAVDSDADLSAMLAELPNSLKESVGEAVASLNQEETEESIDSEDPESAAVEPDEKEVDFETVKANDGVNVRSAASEDATKVGKLAKGDTVKRTEVLDNGWSAVEFEDNICFVKSEYLTVSSVTYKDGTVENLSGTATPTTTINVRSSASENADKVGVVSQGEELTILEILENGWTKIDYNGSEAYVKTEYLQY